MHIPDLCFVSYYLTLAVMVFIFHDKLYLNMCSVELPARANLDTLLTQYLDGNASVHELCHTLCT